MQETQIQRNGHAYVQLFGPVVFNSCFVLIVAIQWQIYDGPLKFNRYVTIVARLITFDAIGLAAENVEASQDTPVMSEREASAVTFNTTVWIQRPLEEIPGRSAIFFEFKHLKPRKNLISTKCFSFMEMDEIKRGRTYLEMLVKY